MLFVRAIPRGVAVPLIAACAALAVSCQKEAPVRKAPPPPPETPNAQAAADTSCRKVGLWTPCAVEDRLVHAGLVVNKLSAPSRYPFFSVEGQAYNIGARDDRVEVFIYPTQAARLQDTRALDSLSASPKGERYAYKVPPLLVTSNNLAALIFTLNERSQERMSLALSAGLPPR